MSGVVRLAQDFPVFSETDWQTAVRRARRLPDASDSENTATLPLYSPARNAKPVVGRFGGSPWTLVQRIDAQSVSAIAAALADDIAGGATGAEIVVAGSAHPAGGHLPSSALADLASALPRPPDGFELRIDTGTTGLPASLLELAAHNPLTIIAAHDPIASTARSRDAAPDVSALSRHAADFEQRKIAGVVAIADGRVWHAAGATDEQELAAVLATYVALLRLVDATGRIGVALAADTDQFRTIAKFRAARLLLARVAELAMLAGEAPRIHAETAWRTMTTLSPETNVVRAAIAAFGAAVGGADSIAVLPFDIASGRRSDTAHRLARNTQLILAHESGIARVADPGAGSGAIEAMTARLAEAAWRRFQAIEKLGGIVAAIAEGSLLREIASARLARAAGMANGEAKMVGVNAYRAEAGAPAPRQAPDRASGLAPFRLAAAFE